MKNLFKILMTIVALSSFVVDASRCTDDLPETAPDVGTRRVLADLRIGTTLPSYTHPDVRRCLPSLDQFRQFIAYVGDFAVGIKSDPTPRKERSLVWLREKMNSAFYRYDEVHDDDYWNLVVQATAGGLEKKDTTSYALPVMQPDPLEKLHSIISKLYRDRVETLLTITLDPKARSLFPIVDISFSKSDKLTRHEQNLVRIAEKFIRGYIRACLVLDDEVKASDAVRE